MIKNFKLYKIKREILAKDGWVELKPLHNHWTFNLSYKLTSNITIELILLEKRDDITIYMENNNTNINNFYFISNYSDNFSELYKMEKDPYIRMMKICNYLMPFFEKKPGDDIIDDIKYIFIDISDELNIDPEIEWGYCSKKEFGFFPAYRHSDILSLSLIYHYVNKDNILNMIEIFNSIKPRLNIIGIEHNRCNIYIEDYEKVVITIDY